MPIDLENLSDEVLFYSNDEFYKFIEEYLGVDEMKLIKLQSIKSSKTLINVPDVLAILSFKCKEIIELKRRLCFIDDGDPENFVVKSGVKTSINDLIKAIQEKNIKHTKRIKYSKSSSTSLNVHNLPTNMSLSNTSKGSSIEIQSTPAEPIPTQPMSINIDTCIESISDRIEKFCFNTFQNLVLKNDHDYIIRLDKSDSEINGSIKCGCNTTIKIVFRSKSNTFQISAYLKHLKNSHCRMIKKKKQDLNQTNRSTNDLLNETLLDNDYSNIDEADDCDEQLIYNNDSTQTTTRNSIINSSNSIQRKRSLPIPSTFNTKKMKSK